MLASQVKLPRVHLLALALYVAGMAAYSVFAIVDWVNAERPVLFSSEETKHFESVPLNVSIDCIDCRRFLMRSQDSAKWKLSWDYSGLPNGCAVRSPAHFDDRLRDFCAVQNNATLYTTNRRYDTAGFGTCNAWAIVLPWSLQPFIPFGATPTMETCMAKCDSSPGCHGINYATAGFSSPDPATGQLVYFPKGVCALLSTNKCPEWQDPDSTVSSPVVTSMLVTDPYKGVPLPAGADPLDRCYLTSNDIDFFTQGPSPNALAATATAQSYRAGFGWNPNYLGTRPTSWADPSSGAADPVYTPTSDTDLYGIGFGTAAHQFGPPTPDAGKGSFYQLDVPVPLCHTSEDATPLQLELLNIPHHAFADPAQIGHATVILSSGSTFKQTNSFQVRACIQSHLHSHPLYLTIAWHAAPVLLPAVAQEHNASRADRR